MQWEAWSGSGCTVYAKGKCQQAEGNLEDAFIIPSKQIRAVIVGIEHWGWMSINRIWKEIVCGNHGDIGEGWEPGKTVAL